MKTVLLLQVQFDGRAQIPLTEISEEFLGLKPTQAARLAGLQQLPFPVHRMGSQKSPWMVFITDLADYIDAQREDARALWEKMRAA